MLPEQVLTAQMGPPHVVDGHGGVELVHEAPQHVLGVVLAVDGGGHLLQDAEEDLLGGAG